MWGHGLYLSAFNMKVIVQVTFLLGLRGSAHHGSVCVRRRGIFLLKISPQGVEGNLLKFGLPKEASTSQVPWVSVLLLQVLLPCPLPWMLRRLGFTV